MIVNKHQPVKELRMSSVMLHLDQGPRAQICGRDQNVTHYYHPNGQQLLRNHVSVDISKAAHQMTSVQICKAQSTREKASGVIMAHAHNRFCLFLAGCVTLIRHPHFRAPGLYLS